MKVPASHPASLDPERLLAACDIRRLRRSGPGGQHRNKVETAVILCHPPSGVVAEANERRSQAANRTVALFRLRVNLALEVRCRPGGAADSAASAPPSPLWQSRCRAGRIAIATTHDDFPTLLAEALDRIATVGADVKAAAAALGCNASQLVKLLKKEHRALALVNGWRRQHDMHLLH